MLSLHTKRKHLLTALFSVAVILPAAIFAGQKILTINGAFAVDYPMPAGFNDQAFYNCIVEQFKSKFPSEVIPDTGLTDEQLAMLTSLSCINQGITDTTGLEKLSNLTTLDLEHNDFSSINLSGNLSLVNVYLMSNGLTSLDITNNSALKTLNVNANEISTLNVSNNSSLTTLSATNNVLVSLDVSNDSSLNTLNVDENQISNLVLTNDLALQTLTAQNNSLVTLDLSTNTGLRVLNVTYNGTMSLDLSNNTALRELRAESNKIESIDLTGLTLLEDVYISNNKLSSIDLSTNINLKNIELNTMTPSSGAFDTLDLSNNVSVVSAKAKQNNITSLSLPNTNTLSSLEVDRNNLTTLDVSSNVNLTNLVAYNNQLSSIDVSNNTALTTLIVYGNNIATMNIAENTALTTFRADNIPVLMNIEALNDENGFDLSNLKFLKATQTISDTGTYTYANKILTITDVSDYTETAQITGVGVGYSYKIILPMVLQYNVMGGDNDPNTGICYPLTEAEGCSINVSGDSPTRDDYVLLGWADSGDSKTAKYQAGDSVQISNTWVKTLYAVWSPIHTLSYDVNGGTGEYPEQTCYNESDISATCSIVIPETEPTYENHVFLGWSADSTATSGGYRGGETIEINADTELKALWGIKYTLDYNTDGGEGSFEPQSCQANNTVDTSCNITIHASSPTKGDYKHFLGWNTNSAATTANYAPSEQISMDGNKTLYAKWTIRHYLAYDMNGASESYSTQDCYGSDTTATSCNVNIVDGTPTKDHRAFLGWADSASAETGEYQKGQALTLENDETTIHAIWGVKYSLGYDLKGGSGEHFDEQECSATTATADACVISLYTESPVLEGFDFYGWSNNEAATVASYQPGTDVSINADKTIYAVWGNKEIDWDGEDFVKGESDGITFHSAYSLDNLERLLIDGNEVPENQYIIDMENNNITIKAPYLDTLEKGDHSVQFEFAGGITVNVDIKIKNGDEGDEPTPEEGQGSASSEIAEDGSVILDLTTPIVRIESVTVNIYDKNGGLVKTVEIESPSENIRIDVSDLANGDYVAESIHKDKDGNVILVLTQNFTKTDGMGYVTLTMERKADITKQVKVGLYDADGNLVRTVVVDTETGTTYVYDAGGNLIDTIEDAYENGKLKLPMNGLSAGIYKARISFLDEAGRIISTIEVEGIEYEGDPIPVPNTGGLFGASSGSAANVAAITIFTISIVVAVELGIYMNRKSTK